MLTNYETESGVPVPKNRAVTVESRTLIKMKIGDSCVVPNGRLNSWRASARRLGLPILVRVIRDEAGAKTDSSRVWRVDK